MKNVLSLKMKILSGLFTLVSLHRSMKNIYPIPRIGLVNGLAVYGPNTGALLEIEVTAIKAKDIGSVNVTGIVEEESIGSQTKSIRRKSMAKGSVDNVLTVLRSLDVLPEGYDIHINFRWYPD